MKCSNCGAQLPDDATFCVDCGSEIKMEQEQQSETEASQPMQSENENSSCDEEIVDVAQSSENADAVSNSEDMVSLNSAGVAKMGIVASVIIIILGLITTFGAFTNKVSTNSPVESSSTVYTYHSTYGGDAYTGMQNASADASNNAAVAAENIALTNKILNNNIKGLNALQNTVSRSVGLLIVSMGILGIVYFVNNYMKCK